jgi:hypothetical protein
MGNQNLNGEAQAANENFKLIDINSDHQDIQP